MRLRPANRTTIWRYAPLALILCLSAAPAFAEAPSETIRRIAQLKVEAQENQRLASAGQLDSRTYNLRRRAIDDEIKTLFKKLLNLSPEERREVEREIKNWTTNLAAGRQQESQPRAKEVGLPKQPDQQKQPRAAAAPRGISPAEYQRDVALAANLLTIPRRAPELDRLHDKWRAAGRGEEFMRDYMKYQMASDQGRAATAVREPPLFGSGTDLPDNMVVTAAIMRVLIVASLIWAYLRRRRSRKADTEPASVMRTWWYPPMVAIALLWAAPIGFTGASLNVADIEALATRGFLVLSALGAAYLYHRLSGRRPAAARPASTVYGTAHYAAMQTDLADADCLSKGIFLGKSSAPEQAGAPLGAPGAPVCSAPEHHTLIVARTRTGKGTRVIVPTLLRYGGSALVIDPKGENAAITAAARRDQLGQTIHILNPWNELTGTYQRRGFKSATYNPLDILDRNDPNAVAIAQTLAGAICPAPPSSKDRFWQGSAANVLTAVFLWLADRPDERKTLARAREIVSLTRKDFTAKYLTPMAASEAFEGAIREMAAPFIDLAQETYSGVMSNLSESTKFLSDPQVKAATAQSSFAMDELATGKTTVYVVVPTERMDTQRTWLRLIISAAMHIFKNPQERRRRGHRCLFMIDEFAALGRLDDLPRDIATMSGFGVDFALIIQGLDQLKDHYAEARGTILSNCAYKWFCNVNDLDSAKYLSDTLGKSTVETESSSDSFSSGSNSSSRSRSTTHSETGRPLLNPDEVLNLGRDVAIAIQPDGHPHYLKPVDYWNLPAAFAALQQEYPALYWNPPLAYDENPYFTPPPPPGGGDGKSREKAKAKSAQPPPREPEMTEERAREIFGVGADANRDEIQAAYRRLIRKVHPDVGGSNYFSQELNAAKALLLGD